MTDKFRELDILLANFERGGGTKRKEAAAEVLTAEQKWSLDIRRVVAELKSGILEKKAPDDVDASALMDEVKDVLLLVRQLVQVLSASSSSLSKEMIARMSPCAAEVGITAKRLHRCLNAGSISLAALGLPPSSVNEDLIHNSLSSNGATATSSNATVRFRGARKIFVAALDALLDVLPPLPSSYSTPSSSSPASSSSTSPRYKATRPTSSFHPPTAAALHSSGGHDQSSAPPRAAGGPPPSVPPDVWQELSQGRKLSSNPRRASLHLALNKRTAVTPGVNDYRRSVAIDMSSRSQTPPASAFRSPRANLTVAKSPRAAPTVGAATGAAVKSPRSPSSRDEEMLELLEQLDSELLTSYNSKEKRATSDHQHFGDAAGHRREDETEVLIQILEDLRLLVQGQVDATINNRAVAFSSSASTLRSLSSAFSDTMTVLKLEIATAKPDGPGESLMRSPPVAERMHDMLVAHHRLFVQTVLAGLGPEPRLTELLSPFPSRIDLVSFPLERLWRSPPVMSMDMGDSFHSLVSSAQQALDRLLARGHADRQQKQQQQQQQLSPVGLAVVKLDDLIPFKADSRQIVTDLKCLHALLLRLSAAETDATTKRARAVQAATLDFAAIVFIRCTVDLIAAACAAPSGSGEGLRASAERWTAATMTLRKTLRAVALLHALLGSS